MFKESHFRDPARAALVCERAGHPNASSDLFMYKRAKGLSQGWRKLHNTPSVDNWLLT
jgi:hypothetical protein